MYKKIVIIVLFCICCMTAESSFAQPQKKIIDEKSRKQILAVINISAKDIKQYKKAFQLIKDENFSQLDEILNNIDNDILMGHLLAEKYLSKTYNTSFNELKEWLEKYSDYPQTRSIYEIALIKKGKNEMPELDGEISKKRYYSPYSWYNRDYEKVRPEYAEYLRKKVTEFRKYINTGKTKKARGILEDATFRKRIPDLDYDAMSATLALVYFLDNEDKLALQWVDKAVRRSHDATASWIGGLASWRVKNYKNAAYYFSRLGGLSDNDEWLISAGAYWAYRSYRKLEKNDEAMKWLNTASKHNRTFYGILASYKLGINIDYNWELTTYYNDFNRYEYLDELLASDAMRRVLILIYAKNRGLAEKELRMAHKSMSASQQELALYVALQYDLHMAAIEIADKLRKNGNHYDGAAYPVPEWEPKEGWKADNALVWALVRQESAFSPTARSSAGARGLMQLMPNTAYHVTKDRNHDALMDISYNLYVGQKYVNYLLNKPFINGNLFFLAAAYNAGPGNLVKWQKKIRYDGDPLLFIESLTARETRLYIKRVMANYWIYNMRFGRKNPSLSQVAKGEWPMVKVNGNGGL